MTVQVFEGHGIKVEVYDNGQFRFSEPSRGDKGRNVLEFNSRNFDASAYLPSGSGSYGPHHLGEILDEPEDDAVVGFAPKLYQKGVRLLSKKGVEVPRKPTGYPEIARFFEELQARPRLKLGQVEPGMLVAYILRRERETSLWNDVIPFEWGQNWRYDDEQLFVKEYEVAMLKVGEIKQNRHNEHEVIMRSAPTHVSEGAVGFTLVKSEMETDIKGFLGLKSPAQCGWGKPVYIHLCEEADWFEIIEKDDVAEDNSERDGGIVRVNVADIRHIKSFVPKDL
jgi:hypothetical protein